MSAASIKSLALRAEAGEVNAREELARISRGEAIGYGVLQRVRAGISRFGAAIVPDENVKAAPHPEDSKPVLPSGALAGLRSPPTFVQTVMTCGKYRDGAWACAVVVASGSRLNAAKIQQMAKALKFTGTQAQCFTHAVKFPDNNDACLKLASRVGPAERCAIAAGQCVGRARILQAARSTARMTAVHNVIGWELGE